MSEDIPEKAISELVRALGKRGLGISTDAVEGLRRRLQTREKSEAIRRALRTGQKSPSDVRKGMEILAIGVAERLQAKKAKTAQMDDIEFALRLHICHCWPICNGDDAYGTKER